MFVSRITFIMFCELDGFIFVLFKNNVKIQHTRQKRGHGDEASINMVGYNEDQIKLCRLILLITLIQNKNLILLPLFG